MSASNAGGGPDRGTAPGPGGTGFATVAIIGCGAIGGSLALAAADVPGVERIVLFDRSEAVRERARQLGLGSVAGTAAGAAEGADLVVIATPLESITQVAAEVWPRMDTHAVLTDVSSVKSRVIVEVEALRGGIDQELAEFVGGHPMAGSERSGPEAADGTMFQGATYVLTPTSASSAGAFNRLATFIRGIGARVLAVDPETHDRLVALVSHVPQVLASTLMAVAADAGEEEPGVLAATGGSFRDVTRVAGSDADLWAGILSENRGAVLDALERFTRSLARFEDALRAGDREALARLLHAGREARTVIPGKEVTEQVIDLVIPVKDRPGSLAEVTTALGGAGVNIEDLAMRHAGGHGALIVSVAGRGAAERARTVLHERGYASHLEER